MAERLLVLEDLILRGYTTARAVAFCVREYGVKDRTVQDLWMPMLRRAWEDEAKTSGHREKRRALMTLRLEDGYRRAATKTKFVNVSTVVDGRLVKVSEEVPNPDFMAMARFSKLIAEINGLREIKVDMGEDLGSVLRKAYARRVTRDKRRDSVLEDESGDSAAE